MAMSTWWEGCSRFEAWDVWPESDSAKALWLVNPMNNKFAPWIQLSQHKNWNLLDEAIATVPGLETQWINAAGYEVAKNFQASMLLPNLVTGVPDGFKKQGEELGKILVAKSTVPWKADMEAWVRLACVACAPRWACIWDASEADSRNRARRVKEKAEKESRAAQAEAKEQSLAVDKKAEREARAAEKRYLAFKEKIKRQSLAAETQPYNRLGTKRSTLSMANNDAPSSSKRPSTFAALETPRKKVRKAMPDFTSDSESDTTSASPSSITVRQADRKNGKLSLWSEHDEAKLQESYTVEIRLWRLCSMFFDGQTPVDVLPGI